MPTVTKSHITLYRTKFLRADKNYKMDHMQNYLNEVASDFSNRGSKSIDNFQFIKHQLHTSIKINLVDSQTTLLGSPESYKFYDYLEVRNFRQFAPNESPNPLDKDAVYYFITKVTVLSQQCVQLDLLMDTLNTLGDDYSRTNNLEWTDKTKINREHKSRFRERSKVNDGDINVRLFRSVDMTQEGINPQLYRNSNSNSIIEYDPYRTQLQNNWYLIYKATKPLSDTDLSNPLKCFLCSNKNMSVTAAGEASININYSDIQSNTYYYIMKIDNPNLSGSYEGNALNFNDPDTIGFRFNKMANNKIQLERIYYDGTIRAVEIDANHQSNFTFTQIEGYRYSNTISLDTYVIHGYTFVVKRAGSQTNVIPLTSIDRTDSKIMQIIELAYPPDEVTYDSVTQLYSFSNNWEYDYQEQLMRLKNLDTEFECEIRDAFEIPNMYPIVNNFNYDTNRNDSLESKVYNSEFYNFKFFYGNDAKQIYYERFIPFGQGSSMQDPDYYKFTIKFIPSSNLSSKSLFEIRANYSAIYHENDDYSEYFSVDRNNQVTLFNNDYLNYMRNGYGYDRAVQKRNSINSAINVGVGLSGSALGLGLTAANPTAGLLALGVSTTSSIISAINNQVASEQSISQKRSELAAQSGSISGADDISLLHKYNRNRLLFNYYKPSLEVRNLLYDLFYYFGYKSNRFGIPQFKSRRFFNYIECEPDIKVIAGSITDEELEDYKNRYRNGVTQFHASYWHGGNMSYDYNQELENWEWFLVRDNY